MERGPNGGSYEQLQVDPDQLRSVLGEETANRLLDIFNKMSTPTNLDTIKPLEARRPRGAWDAAAGAEAWRRRNGIGGEAGRRRFHRFKDDVTDSRGDDDYSVNPATGEIYDQNGENVGNLNDVDEE